MCAVVRNVAERDCDECGKSNGYRVALYAYSTRCGHADCIDASYQRAIFRFIDAIADLLVKQMLKERGREYYPSYADRKEPVVKLEELSERYLLPEYDLDLDVPASQGRGSKQKRTYRLQGKIGDSRRK